MPFCAGACASRVLVFFVPEGPAFKKAANSFLSSYVKGKMSFEMPSCINEKTGKKRCGALLNQCCWHCALHTSYTTILVERLGQPSCLGYFLTADRPPLLLSREGSSEWKSVMEGTLTYAHRLPGRYLCLGGRSCYTIALMSSYICFSFVNIILFTLEQNIFSAPLCLL